MTAMSQSVDTHDKDGYSPSAN